MPHVTGIALAANQDGCLELVAISGREGPAALPGGVWHARQTAPNGDWTGWDSLGQPDSGVSSNAPAVARNADDCLEAVVIADDGTVWHRAQTAPNGLAWSEWRSLARPGGEKATATPVLAQNKDGRLELFVVRYNDETVWHASQQAETGWSGWDSLDKPSGGISLEPNAITVARNVDGRLELFATDGQAMWHRFQRQDGGWSQWHPLGTPETPGVHIRPGVPVVARAGSGRLHLFTVGSDGAIWFRRQSPTAEGGWVVWWTMGRSWFYEVGAGVDAAGRLMLVTTSQEHRLWQQAQVHPEAAFPAGWRQWSSFGTSSYDTPGLLNRPMLASNANGRLELFLLRPGSGGLYQRSQTPSEEWSASVWSDGREWPPPGDVAPAAGRQQEAATTPYGSQTPPASGG
jgi:hypothetical protein